MQPDELIEAARDWGHAFNDQDVDRMLALAAPDCVIVALRSEIEGPYEGHAGLRRWASVFETIPDMQVDLKEIRPLDDRRVLALGRQTGTAGTVSARFDEDFAVIVEFDAGTMRRLRVYPTRAEALAAAAVDP